jgi:hypothetical protein
MTEKFTIVHGVEHTKFIFSTTLEKLNILMQLPAKHGTANLRFSESKFDVHSFEV